MVKRVRTQATIDLEFSLLLAQATGDDGKQVFCMIFEILKCMMER